jgi:hypothetical protein
MIDKKYNGSHRGDAPRRIPLRGKSDMISIDDAGRRAMYAQSQGENRTWRSRFSCRVENGRKACTSTGA